MKDFKEFLLRGNLVDDGRRFRHRPRVCRRRHRARHRPDHAAHRRDRRQPGLLGSLTFTINHSVFRYGAFLNSLITFVVIAAVVFFLVVKPMNALMARRKTEPAVDETVKKCPHCLSSIPVAASVCSFCTRDVGMAAAQ